LLKHFRLRSVDHPGNLDQVLFEHGTIEKGRQEDTGLTIQSTEKIPPEAPIIS
jgi:hypothetical protein